MHTVVYTLTFESGPLKGTSVGPEEVRFTYGADARNAAHAMRRGRYGKSPGGHRVRFSDVHVVPESDDDTVPGDLL